jgi:hypothetical protein
MKTRLIAFAGSTVAVEYSGARPARIVDFVCRHMPGGDDADPVPHVTFRIAPGGSTGELALYREGQLRYTGDCDACLAEQLLGDVGYALADKSWDGLLFHAGALAWDGKGLLLPGSIGAGKTTLTMWLAVQGLGGLAYLSDEMAFFPAGSHAMQTYTRPLNLKSAARAALKDWFDFEGQADRLLSTPHGDLIPPELLSFAGPRAETPLGLIIFPRYAAGSELELRPLSQAQAGLALMECLVNARNLPGHGFSEIARLAQVAPAYRLRYTHFGQIEDQIKTLLVEGGGDGAGGGASYTDPPATGSRARKARKTALGKSS